MKPRKFFIILIGAVVIIMVLIHVAKPNKSYADRIKDKIVVCLDKENLDKKCTDENSIRIDECAEFMVDYSEEQQTILYIDENGNGWEKNIETGDSAEIFRWENSLDFENNTVLSTEDTEEEIIHNLQYGPGNKEISFTYQDSLYIYDFENKKISRVTDCLSSTWCNTYEWKNLNEVYVTPYGDRMKCELYLRQREGEESQFVNDSIRSFVLNDDGTKIYCIRTFYKYNGISMESKDKVMEINLDDGTIRELTTHTGRNYLLKIVNNKYLFYIEQVTKRNEMNRLYCLNLTYGQKERIYQTDKEIIGIIIK